MEDRRLSDCQLLLGMARDTEKTREENRTIASKVAKARFLRPDQFMVLSTKASADIVQQSIDRILKNNIIIAHALQRIIAPDLPPILVIGKEEEEIKTDSVTAEK